MKVWGGKGGVPCLYLLDVLQLKGLRNPNNERMFSVG